MHPRYTRPEMQELWSDERKFQTWLEVELAVLAARANLDYLPREAHQVIARHARVVLAQIEEFESRYRHDMIAFIKSVRTSLEEAGVGEYANAFHEGITSYDIEDPALMLLLKEATLWEIKELRDLETALREKAAEHKWTMMIARTHGQYAEPSTFGLLLLVFAEAVRRSIERLQYAVETELAEGKISGAVGTYAGMNPKLEEEALAILGLLPARAETQILQRDRHATLVNILAVAGGTIEQIARTFWQMMRSDVGELEEPRAKEQRGSSAMPHKNNPIFDEQFMGLARVIRGCAGMEMESIATVEWRDISQSSVERHVFPIATGLLHYMATAMTRIVRSLVVFPERMMENLQNTRGVWAGQRVHLALIEAGVPYDTAYECVQKAAFKAVRERMDFHDVLFELPLSPQTSQTALHVLESKLGECFNAKTYIEKGVDHIFKKCGN